MFAKLKSVFRVVINRLKFLSAALKGTDIKCARLCTSRLSTEFSFSKRSKVRIGKHFTSMQNCRILVRDGELVIGDHVGINSNCVIVCHHSIHIGSDVGIGPNVCIYDHDHDFRIEGGKAAKKYRCSPVVIEDNVWIGANTIILRGVRIGKIR